MSLHKSKGLSSPYVFIAGCVQGILPPLPETGTPKAVADAELEEARRLFYVGKGPEARLQTCRPSANTEAALASHLMICPVR